MNSPGEREGNSQNGVQRTEVSRYAGSFCGFEIISFSVSIMSFTFVLDGDVSLPPVAAPCLNHKHF